MANFNKPFKGRNDNIKFVDEYGSMILEAKRKATKEEPEAEPSEIITKRKKSPLELREKLINEIKNYEKIYK